MSVFHALFGEIAEDTFEDHDAVGKVLWHIKGTSETFLMASLRSNKNNKELKPIETQYRVFFCIHHKVKDMYKGQKAASGSLSQTHSLWFCDVFLFFCFF